MSGTDESVGADGGASGAGYLRPYEEATRRHGPVFEATLWASKPKQAGRFAVFAEEIDLAGRTVVDAGAGLGDLAAFLLESGIEYEHYHAIEGVGDMATAIGERGLARSTVQQDDFAGDAGAFDRAVSALRSAGHGGAEVVLFSGSLNTFGPEAALEAVDRAWSVATHAVGFNFLSDRHHKRNPVNPAPAVRFDPVPVLDWALARTPGVLLRQDYFEGHDCSVIMWKPGEARQHRWVQA